MYPFPHSVNPAMRSHIDAQTAYMNDVSKSIFRSFQQMMDLNIQLAQTMLEETALIGKQMVSADRQSEVLGAAASRAQPASDKLRAYQQHITRLAADTQVELARVTEQHGQTTARTARVLADEVARDATEQTERGLRAQQEVARQFSDPFMRDSGSQARTGMPNGQSGMSMGNNDSNMASQSATAGEKQPAGQASRGASAH
jgi:phasin family protein